MTNAESAREEIICGYREVIQEILEKKIKVESDLAFSAADELIHFVEAWKDGDAEFDDLDKALTALKIKAAEWHVLEQFQQDGGW